MKIDKFLFCVVLSIIIPIQHVSGISIGYNLKNGIYYYFCSDFNPGCSGNFNANYDNAIGRVPIWNVQVSAPHKLGYSNPITGFYSGVVIVPDTIYNEYWEQQSGGEGGQGNILKAVVSAVDYMAFAECNELTSITLPQTIQSIGYHAFYNCINLQSITIKTTTPPTTVDTDAFYGVPSSIPIYVPCESVDAYKKADGWKTFKNIMAIIPYNIQTIAKEDNGSINIKGLSTNCSDYSIQLTATPDSGYHFVKWSDEITDNPRTIPLTQDTAFTAIFEEDKCLIASGTCGDNLTWELTCDSVLTISGSGEMIIPKYSPWYDFKEAIKYVVIEDDITTIGLNAFMHCTNLIFAKIPNGVTRIESGAFIGCAMLPQLTIPNSVKSIGNTAFSSCYNLSTIEIPNSVITIGSSAFWECRSLISISLPDSLQKIESCMFQYCRSLQRVTIPSQVSKIESQAFYDCTSIDTIYNYSKTPQELGNVAISSIDKSRCILYVPGASIAAYKSADQWKDFTNILPIPGTEIPCGADIRMPAPEYTFKHIVEKCTSSLQFTNTSHVITRYNGEEVHTAEPCTDVLWRFRRLSDNKKTETSELNPVYQCRSIGDTIEVTFTSYLDAGMCDSTRIDTFVVPNIIPVNSEYHTSICADDSILFDGKWFNEDTVYTAHYTSLAGCDSTSTLFLTVYPSYEFITDTTVYVGDEVMWHNGYIKPEKAGTYHYVDTLKTYFGCDSIFVLNLDVKPRSQKMCSWLVESSDLEMGVVTTDFTEPFYKYGTQITVEASPNSGYKFVKWNDGKKYNPYKFSLLDDKYLLAIFVAEDEEQDSTTVSPSSTSATFTWPFIVGGFSYSLTIYLDFACTMPLCTITFNQYGQLVGISFGGKHAPRRMPQEEGFTYTVSDLNANTTYYYKMETKDEHNKLINTDEGMFKTTNDATGIENQYNSDVEHRKIMIDGQILILRGDRIYTLQGQEIR